MAELGETSAKGAAVKALKKGKVKVSVRDVCSGARIEGAKVVVEGNTAETDSSGEATISDLSTGANEVKVNKHFKDADYLTFITHKPKITRSFEAKSAGEDLANVEGEKTAKIRVEIPVYKVVESVRFCRIHLKLKPELDYGHWWIEVGDKSYGWWPEQGHLGAKEMDEPSPPPPLAESASIAQKISRMAQMAAYRASMARYAANNSVAGIYGQAIGKTFMGVPGILNGSEERKSMEKDYHHEDWLEGKTDEDYHPVIVDCRTKDEIHKAIRDFAFAYSGEWSWRFEFGKNCHTFQIEAMNKISLDKVKEI